MEHQFPRFPAPRILGPMALPALQQAMDTYAAAPHMPPELPAAGAAQRQDILRKVQRFADGVAAWRANMITVRQSLAQMCRDAVELRFPSPLLKDALSGLDEFIEIVDQSIGAERTALDQSELGNRQVVATMMKKSSDNAHFARKVLKRMYEAGVLQHNTRVDFYYFLLALRAEHDPEAHGGPEFSDPIALEKYLLAQREGMGNANRCIARIAELASLSPGWHDGDGEKITRRAVEVAHELVRTRPELTEHFYIYPTIGGGILFEFEIRRWDFSIEIAPSGAIELYGVTTDDEEVLEPLSFTSLGPNLMKEINDRTPV